MIVVILSVFAAGTIGGFISGVFSPPAIPSSLSPCDRKLLHKLEVSLKLVVEQGVSEAKDLLRRVTEILDADGAPPLQDLQHRAGALHDYLERRYGDYHIVRALRVELSSFSQATLDRPTYQVMQRSPDPERASRGRREVGQWLGLVTVNPMCDTTFPTTLGSVLLGGFAAVVSFGLYGPLSGDIVVGEPQAAQWGVTIGQLASSVLIGMGGGTFLFAQAARRCSERSQ